MHYVYNSSSTQDNGRNHRRAEVGKPPRSSSPTTHPAAPLCSPLNHECFHLTGWSYGSRPHNPQIIHLLLWQNRQLQGKIPREGGQVSLHNSILRRIYSKAGGWADSSWHQIATNCKHNLLHEPVLLPLSVIISLRISFVCQVLRLTDREHPVRTAPWTTTGTHIREFSWIDCDLRN